MEFNQQLRDELLSMQEEDQRVLRELIDSGEVQYITVSNRKKMADS